MDCERDGISVLIVDDDEISLAILANILIAWKCKVLTAKSVRNALETLREFEGFFDLVIAEFHMPGMSGFEFQKHVKDEFQIPVIMMCANNRKNVISKSLEDDATLFIMKPFCADDFKNIWKYAIDARKEKLVIENKLTSGEGDATLSSTEPKSKRKYCKRKCQREDQIEGRFRALKKPKIVWTTYLHNLFLFAIKQLGMDKAVPKKILEVMNVPTLTRENVASHLQKYRIFLRKVAEKGMIEGLSHRALRSKFASGLPISVIQEIKTRSEKLHHVHAQQYLQSVSYQSGNALKPNFNQVPISLVNQQVSSNNNNTYVSTTQLGRSQYPYLHQGLMLQNQYANPLKSSFGSNIGINNNIYQNMLGRFANPPYHLSNCSYNDGAKFSAYGGGHGLMTSAKCLSGGLNLKYGDPLNQNYGSIGNHNYGYGLGKRNMGSLSSSYNILPQTNTYYPSINSSGIQLNGGLQMVETVKKGGFNSVGINAATANNNSFGFMNRTQNANMNVASLVLESFGNLVQGKFGFDSVSNAGIGRGSELPATLITAENISRITELPQLKLDGNSVENEHQFSNATSISEGKVNQIEDDLSELFLMLDDMNLLNEMEEIPNASEFWNSDLSNSCQVGQPLEQFNRAGDVIVPLAKSTSNLPNESPTSSEQNSNQLGGDDGFANREPYDRIMGDNVSSASTSATDQDWDMELIEALFGTVEN